MRRLILLVFLGGALAVAVGVLYAMGRSGLAAESRRIQSEASAAQRQTLTAVRSQVARALTAVVERESKRPYYQYRALYVPPGLVAQQPAFVPSPLSEAPEDPLVKCYFEFREGTFTSPALFQPRQRKQNKQRQEAMAIGSSPYGKSIRPLLADLGQHTAQLHTVLRVPDPQSGPVFQRVIDSYVHLLNRQQELYLQDLEQDSKGKQVAMNRAWKASQQRVGKVPGQYQAPRPSKQPIEVKRFPFEVVALGASQEGWPRHVVALRRVAVGEETWLQGFAFDLAHLRDATLPQAVASQSVAFEPGISPSLDWSRVRALESSRGQTIGELVDLIPSAEASGLTHETLPLLDPLQGLTLVHRQGPIDAAAALRPSRTLLDGALGLAGAVVLLGSVILLLAARGQRRLAQQRADFVAALTHELKAPLTGMRALAEMLHDGLVRDEAKKHEYYASMLGEAERLGRLVQNVLDAAKLERGATLSVICEPLDPGPMLADLAGRFRSRYETLGLSLEVDLGDETPPVLADRESLVQVVANLLDNAAKYGRGGENVVRLEARVDGDRLAIAVSDQGPGVAPAERERIFEQFFRSPDAPREVGGAGLGLAIARAQARAQGGDLVVGEADGGGARFTLSLRVASSP